MIRRLDIVVSTLLCICQCITLSIYYEKVNILLLLRSRFTTRSIPTSSLFDERFIYVHINKHYEHINEKWFKTLSGILTKTSTLSQCNTE